MVTVMSNPLFRMLGANAGAANPMANIMQRFRQFQQSFRGDAGQQIQQLLNSGRVNQQQYDQAVQMARQFQKMIGGK